MIFFLILSWFFSVQTHKEIIITITITIVLYICTIYICILCYLPYIVIFIVVVVITTIDHRHYHLYIHKYIYIRKVVHFNMSDPKSTYKPYIYIFNRHIWSLSHTTPTLLHHLHLNTSEEQLYIYAIESHRHSITILLL